MLHTQLAAWHATHLTKYAKRELETYLKGADKADM